MEKPNTAPYDRTRIVSGIKTAALIVILGAVAVAADHAFFIAPYSRMPAEAAPPVAVAAPVEGYALPDNLRPTAADVGPAPPSF